MQTIRKIITSKRIQLLSQSYSIKHHTIFSQLSRWVIICKSAGAGKSNCFAKFKYNSNYICNTIADSYSDTYLMISTKIRGKFRLNWRHNCYPPLQNCIQCLSIRIQCYSQVHCLEIKINYIM